MKSDKTEVVKIRSNLKKSWPQTLSNLALQQKRNQLLVLKVYNLQHNDEAFSTAHPPAQSDFTCHFA